MTVHANPRATVLVTVELAAEAEQRLAQFAQVITRPDLTPEQASRAIRDVDALIVGQDWAIFERLLDRGQRLTAVGALSADMAPEAFAEAQANGVTVIRRQDPALIAQAEQVMALLLTCVGSSGSDGLAGKTLGMVGFGPVGCEVAKRGRSFGLRLLTYAPEGRFADAGGLGLRQMDLPDLLSDADLLCVELPGGGAPGLRIGQDELSICRAGTRLVSMAGFAALDTGAMLKALDRGDLGSAFIVVGPDEQLPFPEGWHPGLRVVRRAVHGWRELEAQSQLELVEGVLGLLRALPRDETLALQVVPLLQVLPHENTDPGRVADLIERFKSEATLINPPLVTPMQAGYVLLDGATRLAALKAMGFPALVVQIVDPRDPKLSLGTWNHVIRDLTHPELIAILDGVPGCELVATSPAQLWPALDRGEALCAVTTRDYDAYLVRGQKSAGDLSLLNDIVAAYTHAGRVERLASPDLAALQRKAPDFSALVRFPPFCLEDVIRATLEGQRIPQGITRFVVPGRILHLHVDLARLKADEPLEVKRRWLRELVASRYAKHAVRHYPEPVTLMDE